MDNTLMFVFVDVWQRSWTYLGLFWNTWGMTWWSLLVDKSKNL